MNIRNMFQNKKSIIGIFVVMTIFASTDILHAQVVSGSINGHDYVDLGLPSGVLWATCNVGASRPYDYGNYYAWGEIKTKYSYDESNFDAIDKGVFDDIANTYRDVACLDWKSAWRMPTKTELDELVRQCTWKRVAFGGRNGYQIIGPNGNSIFLPAAGGREESLKYEGLFGGYWSSTPNEGNTKCPWYLKFLDIQGNIYVDITYRPYVGYPIRPVANPIIWKEVDGYYNNDAVGGCGGCSNFRESHDNESGYWKFKGELNGVYLDVEDGDVIIYGRAVYSDSSLHYQDPFRIKVKQYGKEVNNNSVWRRIYIGVNSNGTKAKLALDYKQKWVLYTDDDGVYINAKDFHEVSGSFDL